MRHFNDRSELIAAFVACPICNRRCLPTLVQHQAGSTLRRYICDRCVNQWSILWDQPATEPESSL
jgi:hypothetical protein